MCHHTQPSMAHEQSSCPCKVGDGTITSILQGGHPRVTEVKEIAPYCAELETVGCASHLPLRAWLPSLCSKVSVWAARVGMGRGRGWRSG